MILPIARDWAGRTLDEVHGEIELARTALELSVRGWARQAGGDAVPHPPGRAPRLWEHEVLELFLLGADAHYLELEFGPGGHWLALRMHGERKLVSDALVLDPAPIFAHEAGRWSFSLTLPESSLPLGLRAANAYAIVGPRSARRYLAWRGPVHGEKVAPDFHALRYFGELDASALKGER